MFDEIRAFFAPRRTVAEVAQTLASGLEDGSIVLAEPALPRGELKWWKHMGPGGWSFGAIVRGELVGEEGDQRLMRNAAISYDGGRSWSPQGRRGDGAIFVHKNTPLSESPEVLFREFEVMYRTKGS